MVMCLGRARRKQGKARGVAPSILIGVEAPQTPNNFWSARNDRSAPGPKIIGGLGCLHPSGVQGRSPRPSLAFLAHNPGSLP